MLISLYSLVFILEQGFYPDPKQFPKVIQNWVDMYICISLRPRTTNFIRITKGSCSPPPPAAKKNLLNTYLYLLSTPILVGAYLLGPNL
jgi:hypothetical protein